MYSRLQVLTDFSQFEVDVYSYRGSDNKRCVYMDGRYYMVKLADNEMAGNVISEYLGSHIMQTLGLEAHNTLLGRWGDIMAVACEDFCQDGAKLHEFSWYMQTVMHHRDVCKHITYKQLYKTFDECKFLQPIRDKAVKTYWDMIVGDALIGNFDRHKDNWGYLVSPATQSIAPAPIYDCGGCLYPQLSENDYDKVLNDSAEIERRMYEFPKMDLLNNYHVFDKLEYYSFFASGSDKAATASLLDVYLRVDMDKVFGVVNNTPVITDKRKHFYKEMLKHRKEMILDKAYKAVTA